ncbi:MAG: uracil-DNA glycosylase family protein [Thiolinea sp.]
MTDNQKFLQLVDEVQSCRICEDVLPLGARPVFIVRPQARILIVGQAPGIRVHNTGVTFNDPSGDRLRKWLGVGREMFYHSPHLGILPMGFCYPGTGKSGDLPPRKECAVAWRERLLAVMPEVELTLLLGQYAQQYHLGKRRKKNLTETARAWEEYWPEYLPLPHPSPRNIAWLQRNPWLEGELIPVLQQRVQELLVPESG